METGFSRPEQLLKRSLKQTTEGRHLSGARLQSQVAHSEGLEPPTF